MSRSFACDPPAIGLVNGFSLSAIRVFTSFRTSVAGKGVSA
jgi:hypothetical protein